MIVGPKLASEGTTQIFILSRNGTEFMALDHNGQPCFIAIEDLLTVANIEGAATEVSVALLDARMAQAEGMIVDHETRLDVLEGQWVTINTRLDGHDVLIAGLASGSPKGVYATLSALVAAYPAGTTGIFVVQADGHWYWWNGAAWTDGGAYLASTVSDGTTTYNESRSIKYVDGEPFYCITLDEV